MNEKKSICLVGLMSVAMMGLQAAHITVDVPRHATSVWPNGEIPLPEHPRPDFCRAEWQNLNGKWDFRFDGRGKSKEYDQQILVPFGWGSPLSGVKNGGDTGWYRREITVPAAWKGKRVFVVVGASDHDTDCVFAGIHLGRHSGGYTPFEFELTDYVKWGENQKLEFKVWDPDDRTARHGHYLYGKQGYGNARGIWQTVYLEARADLYVERVAFAPADRNGTVDATVVFSAPAKAKTVCRFELDGKTFEFDPFQKYLKPMGYLNPVGLHHDYTEKGRRPWKYRAAGSAIVPDDSTMPYPRLCAHRGFSKAAPENTMPAFGAAIAP